MIGASLTDFSRINMAQKLLIARTFDYLIIRSSIVKDFSHLAIFHIGIALYLPPVSKNEIEHENVEHFRSPSYFDMIIFNNRRVSNLKRPFHTLKTFFHLTFHPENFNYYTVSNEIHSVLVNDILFYVSKLSY